MKFGVIALHADIEVASADLRIGEIAEPIIIDGFKRAVCRPITAPVSGFSRDLLASEGSEHRIDVPALIVEAVFHIDDDGASQGVKPKYRVANDNSDVVDRVR